MELTHNKISIVILTYNSISLIKECIDSIFRYVDVDSYEIIVVDNSNLVESKKIASYLYQLYGEKVIFHKSPGNIGYGAGNNYGIQYASGDILCIMNPDVRLVEPIFMESLRLFNQDNKLALLGYKQIGGCNLSYYIMPQYRIPILSDILIKFCNRLSIYNKYLFYLSGALLFIDKQKFLKIGAFDENLFMYYEEPDITTRLLRNNYKIKFNRAKQYIHLIGSRQFNEYLYNIEVESFLYYLQKYYFNIGLRLSLYMIELSLIMKIARKKSYHSECRFKIKLIKQKINSYN